MVCMLGKVFQNTGKKKKIYEITLKNIMFLKAKHLIPFIIQGLAILQSLYTLHDLIHLLLLLYFSSVTDHGCKGLFTSKSSHNVLSILWRSKGKIVFPNCLIFSRSIIACRTVRHTQALLNFKTHC